jgi:hypothetical protein
VVAEAGEDTSNGTARFAQLEGQIIEAARKGDAERLARLLDQHPDKLALKVPPYEASLLFPAAQSGNIDAVELLLKRGLDVTRVPILNPWAPLPPNRSDAVRRAGALEPSLCRWATILIYVNERPSPVPRR